MHQQITHEQDTDTGLVFHALQVQVGDETSEFGSSLIVNKIVSTELIIRTS